LALVLPGTTPVRADVDSVDIHLLRNPWKGWRSATCLPDHCFCERIRDGAIRQPANTWSNLAFILTGMLIIAMAGHDLTQASSSAIANPMRSRFVYPGIYAVATILVGIGSTFYHTSLSFVGQTVDVVSMYLLTSFMLLYNLSRMRRTSSRAFAACYLVANIALGYMAIEWPLLRRYIFVVLLLAVSVSEVIVRGKLRPRMNVAFLYAALVSLATACATWILDTTRVVCSPDSWLQGHATWHILMAVLIGFMYLYYRSEAGCVAHRASLPSRVRFHDPMRLARRQ